MAANASPPVQWRMACEVIPSDWTTPADLESLLAQTMEYKGVTQLIRKQRDNGTWLGKILEAGTTIDSYRRLLEFGIPPTHRSFQVANRVLYRLLSRDPDPLLRFEFKKDAKADPAYDQWSRDMMRQAATACLAKADEDGDPRVRGSAQRIANSVSAFLRSDLAQSPFIKSGSRHVLNPEAYPPTVYAVSVLARMPSLQRERAGFADRLAVYVTKPAPKKAYWVKAGKKSMKPGCYILGDPLQLESTGRPKDIPFALHWLELLARLDLVHTSASAQRAVTRMLRDCNEEGIWNPKGLRAVPSSSSGAADFAFPLETDTKSATSRRVDVTFRLALIAKLLGLELEFV
jgi:hypothetical protein